MGNGAGIVSPRPAELELFHSAQPPSKELGTNSGELNHSRHHRAVENKDREDCVDVLFVFVLPPCCLCSQGLSLS